MPRAERSARKSRRWQSTQKNCSSKVVQPVKIFGTLPSDIPELKVYVYDPTTTGAVLSDVRPTGLALQTALPSGAFSRDGVLYVCSEEPNPAGGKQVVVARSPDEGVTWTKLPSLPGTTTGTATFTWVAAGDPGHIGVLYYYSADNGSDSGVMTTSDWDAVWAESFNADTAAPTWAVTTVESLVHTGAICAAAGCMGTDRFAGDFISALIDTTGAAHLTWMKQENGTGAISIRYQRIQSGPISTYLPAPCGATTPPVPLESVKSRKFHDGTPYYVDLPVNGPHGVECRTGPVAGEYTMIFRFVNSLTNVDSTNVSSGTGEVHDSNIDPNDDHQYIVNLTGVTNVQNIFVTLHNVHDSDGNVSDTLSAPMSILIGDVDASRNVTGADVNESKTQVGATVSSNNFRDDIDVTGAITGSDVNLVKAQVGTSLP